MPTPEVVLLLTDDTPAHAHPLADRYEFLAELGLGGMSVVYRMRERATGRQVAVKLAGGGPGPAAEAALRLVHEAEVAGTLRHPHLVAVLPVWAADGTLALVSPYLAGGTLRAALEGARRATSDGAAAFDYGRAARVLRDVAAGLAHAHACGIVHADVKPENVFLDGEDGRALLADFGIARRIDARVPRAGSAPSAGTPSYMAPEQVTGGPLDARTDVYALGLVGWEMLAGRRPWQGLPLDDVLHRQRFEALPALDALRPDIPAYLLTAIAGAVAKRPEARWRDAAEFLERLTPTPAQLPALPARPGRAGDDAAEETLHFPAVPASRATAGGTADAARPRGGRQRRVASVGFAFAVACVAALSVARVRSPHATNADPASVAATVAHGTVAHGEVRLAGAPVRAVPQLTVPQPTVPQPTGAAARADRAQSAIDRSALALTDRRRRVDPCASPDEAAQRACFHARTAAGDAALVSAYDDLTGAMLESAGGDWEPAAVRTLRAEQRGWLAARASACRAQEPADPGAAWGAARAACYAERAERRVAELRARRARFSPSEPEAPERRE